MQPKMSVDSAGSVHVIVSVPLVISMELSSCSIGYSLVPRAFIVEYADTRMYLL